MRILARTGTSFDREQPHDEGFWTLDCWQDYLVEFDNDEDSWLPASAVQHRIDSEQGPRFVVNFGDYVGRVRLGDGHADVCSPKLRPDEFDQLLTSITKWISDLPFDFNSPTFVPFDRMGEAQSDILYQAFVYLRFAMSHAAQPPLSETWAQVAADPHRTLVRSERRERPWEARGISPRTIEKIICTPGDWQAIGPDSPAYSSPLAVALEHPVSQTRFAPLEVVEVVAESCIDTPENRFAKYCIQRISDIAARAHELLSDTKADPGLVADARGITEATQQMASAHFLREVSDMRYFPSNSQVLQKRAPYRDLLRHHQALAFASSYPISGSDLSLLIDAKSASSLYEYWCFFECARAVESVSGLEASAPTASQGDLRSELDYGLALTYDPLLSLHFNRTFCRRHADWQSYSVTLRPDIVLKCRDKLHLFDAKFRIQTWGVDEAAASEDLDAAEADDRSGRASDRWWKSADIHKMHAYRDALGSDGANVQTVWVLYPGDRFVFYADDGRKLNDRSEFSAEMSGVGAIPLAPAGDSEILQSVFAVLLADQE